MEENKKIKAKYQIEYKKAVINTAIFKLTESTINNNELEVFLELAQLLKQVVKVDEQALAGFLLIAYELMQKSGQAINFGKFSEVDITDDESIKELIVYFKRVIVLALVNRVYIFQINENIDELMFNSGKVNNGILNN